jgi:nucleoside-diphosphate-sugar epimerase
MAKVRQVLITGGAGFIGRRLARLFLDRGVGVCVFDTEATLAGAPPADLPPDVERTAGDTKDREAVFQAVGAVDAVVHLAAGSSFLQYEVDPINETVNVVHGFLNVLEAVKQHRVSRFVYASTSAVYEGNAVPYREDMRLTPPDHKALAKKHCEELAALYRQRYKVRSVGVRPFSVYGPGEHSKKGMANVLSLFTWAMLNKKRPRVWKPGSQTRDFICVDDVAKIFYHCATRGFAHPIVNAGTGTQTSFNKVIRLIRKELGYGPVPEYVSKPKAVTVYATRLQANTELQCEMKIELTPIEKGIRQVIDAAESLPKDIRDELAGAQKEHLKMLSTR